LTGLRIRACAVEDVAPGEVHRVEGDGHEPVAVYNVGGEFFCIDDTCTHEKYPLSEGWVDDDVVECALHMAKFCVRDGRALCLPAPRGVAAHPVEVVDGEIWVNISKASGGKL
jgi:nitrite reductase/ring-hydroxylating ferredoxin subunit